MITAVTEKFYCQELESESSHCLPGTISVILSLVTSLLKITLNFAISTTISKANPLWLSSFQRLFVGLQGLKKCQALDEPQSGRTMTVAENLDFKWMWVALDHLSSLQFTMVESLQSTISYIEKTLISPSINIQNIWSWLVYCISLHSLDFNLRAKPAYEWVS